MPADVRWCLRCHARAYELAPRAPLHDLGVVGTPKSDVAVSRTKASATTWGLTGRIVLTAIVAYMTLNNLAPILSGGIFWLPFFLMWCAFATVILRQVWKAVPVEDAFEPPRIRLGDIWRAGFEVAPEPPPRRTTAMKVWRVVTWVVGAAAAAAFTWGPPPVQAGVLFLATLWATYAFFRGYLRL